MPQPASAHARLPRNPIVKKPTEPANRAPTKSPDTATLACIPRLPLLFPEGVRAARACGIIRLLSTGFDPSHSAAAYPGRILALDVGKKRIGLAISDELGITAQGLPTLQRTRIREDLLQLNALVHSRGVTLLLVGRPLHMTGTESRQSVYTEEFAERLRQACGGSVPVAFWDERLTTVEAERVLREGHASLDERKRSVDRLSAVLLLESYLEHQQIARAAGNGGADAGEPFLE